MKHAEGIGDVASMCRAVHGRIYCRFTKIGVNAVDVALPTMSSILIDTHDAKSTHN
jgi:hypothetical protein